MIHLITTFFYVGHIRPAPGTWGSLAALPFAWLIITLSGTWGLAIASIAAFWIGLWATREDTKGKDDHDPSEIVIDEVAGQWIALLPVAFIAGFMGTSSLNLWPLWLAAFGLFRLFDITKPSLVGWADKRDDAMGVMLDDVIAGVFAAVVIAIVFAIFGSAILPTIADSLPTTG